MSTTRIKLLIIIAAIFGISFLGIIIYGLSQNLLHKEQAQTQTREAANINSQTMLEKSDLGYIISDGFEFSYLANDQIYILTITSPPFVKNLSAAKEYLKNNQILLDSLPHICMAGPDVTDVTESELTKCSNTTIP